MRFIYIAMFLLMAFAPQPVVSQTSAPLTTARVGQAPDQTSSVPSKRLVKLDAADLEAWLDGFIPFALERNQIPGAVIVVVQGDKVLLQKGYGFSDVAKRTAVDPATTLFRPGSISKLFTWTAVMQLVEAGKLDLDKDINSYLDFKIPPYEGKPVTLRHLMTHMAGFEESAHYLFTTDPKALIPLKKLMPLNLPKRVFAPGTTPAYSNYGAGLAGYIVERVSGELFDDYIDNHIFNPLGMKHATFRQPLPGTLAPLMSQGYPDDRQKPKPYEIVMPAPAGSLAASGADMGKFMIAHLNDGAGLMSAATTRMMHDYKAPNIGPLNSMALGFIEQSVNGHRSITHGGDTQWFHSNLWLFPDTGIGLYISTNGTGKADIRYALFHKFADRYLPRADKSDMADKPGMIDANTARAHAQSMVGNYVNSRVSFTNFLSVAKLIEQLKVELTDDGKITLPQLEQGTGIAFDWVEVAPYVWRDAKTGERLAAEVKDGRIVRMSLDMESPIIVFMPAPAGINAAWLHPALIAALAILLFTAIMWPVRALVRRHFAAPSLFEGKELRAYRVSRVFAWLALAALAGWAGYFATVSNDIGYLDGSIDWLIQLLRVLMPIATLGLFVSAAWYFRLAWAGKHRWTTKLGALLLMLAALPFVWITFVFHLYGFGLVY